MDVMAELSQVALLGWIAQKPGSDRGFGRASLSRQAAVWTRFTGSEWSRSRRFRPCRRSFGAGWQAKGVSVGLPRIENRFVSQDGTVRYLIAFADGQSVETVWMPEGDGGEAGDGSEAGDVAERFADMNPQGLSLSSEETPAAELKPGATQKQKRDQRAKQGQNQGRSTICISSQVGCAVDCQFCLTALLGVKRNLTAGEIVGQVCAVLKDQKVSPPEDRINLVFMGMGEPFLNYDNFMKAARLLVEEVGIAERRMTVSTAGIVPRIHDFGEEKIRPKLAISLNASNDDLRTRLMPLNKKWNLEMLMAAAQGVSAAHSGVDYV